ncbi:Polyunsaturated fatty acid /-lipoxygenase, epidermal-type [Plecturocebus cupreus]
MAGGGGWQPAVPVPPHLHLVQLSPSEGKAEPGFSEDPKPHTELRPVAQEVEIDVPLHLGRLLMVKLCKRNELLSLDWFCKWISVQGPGTQGEAFFPFYRWTVSDGLQHLFKKYREQELEERRKVCQWGSWKDGLILPIAGNRQPDLSRGKRFLEEKDLDFKFSLGKGLKDLAINETLDFTNCVRRLEDFKKIFPRGKTPLAGQFPQPPKSNIQISNPGI